MRIVKVNEAGAIPIGRIGENEATLVIFDISDWPFAPGTFQLLVQRPGDANPYPAAIEQSSCSVTWLVADSDLAVAGNGQAMLVLFDGDTIAKSRVYQTIIGTALTGSGETPEPYEDWVNRVLAAGTESEEILLEIKDIQTGVYAQLEEIRESVDTQIAAVQRGFDAQLEVIRQQINNLDRHALLVLTEDEVDA